MRTLRSLITLVLVPAGLLGAPPSPVPSSTFTVPVTYYKLPNGLRVALSPDHSAPTVAVAVYYRIGFRV